jgi:hypothetical protein
LKENKVKSWIKKIEYRMNVLPAARVSAKNCNLNFPPERFKEILSEEV